MKRKDLTGQRFGKLVCQNYESLLETNGTRKRIYWTCQCDCGNSSKHEASTLIQGEAKSCGCSQFLSLVVHGYSQEPLYRVWQGMKDRCSGSPGSSLKALKNYHNKGIKVCEEWNLPAPQGYINFKKWAINHPTYKPGLTIDRIDPKGNYEPSNCRWRTHKEQQYNKENTFLIEVFSETLNLMEALIKYGHPSLTERVIWRRITELGWNAERAVVTPRITIYHKGSK